MAGGFASSPAWGVSRARNLHDLADSVVWRSPENGGRGAQGLDCIFSFSPRVLFVIRRPLSFISRAPSVHVVKGSPVKCTCHVVTNAASGSSRPLSGSKKDGIFCVMSVVVSLSLSSLWQRRT